eukprot:1492822-Prorocentrum_lima.AAC.1
MTSSLVGSEMCIRDRARAIERHCPLAQPHFILGLLGCPPRGYCKFRPVSYTHLTLPTICSV